MTARHQFKNPDAPHAQTVKRKPRRGSGVIAGGRYCTDFKALTPAQYDLRAHMNLTRGK